MGTGWHFWTFENQIGGVILKNEKPIQPFFCVFGPVLTSWPKTGLAGFEGITHQNIETKKSVCTVQGYSQGGRGNLAGGAVSEARFHAIWRHESKQEDTWVLNWLYRKKMKKVGQGVRWYKRDPRSPSHRHKWWRRLSHRAHGLAHSLLLFFYNGCVSSPGAPYFDGFRFHFEALKWDPLKIYNTLAIPAVPSTCVVVILSMQ